MVVIENISKEFICARDLPVNYCRIYNSRQNVIYCTQPKKDHTFPKGKKKSLIRQWTEPF